MRAIGSLDEIISASLDRHALRLQRVVEPPADPRRLLLRDAGADDWRLVVDALAPFVKEKRLRRMQRILRHRRSNLHLVVENISDPMNSQSLLRTAEALGVQNVHIVEAVCEFQLPVAEAQAASRGTVGRSDMGEGAVRWLTLHKYRTSSEALSALRAAGVRVLVSDCPTDEEEAAELPGLGWHTAKRGEGPVAQPLESFDFASCTATGGGVGLVFGNERRGCSRTFTEGADATFYLPMSGFTQSFNIGVALAMSLGTAIDSGAFAPGTLTEDERAELLGRWLIRDLKQAGTLLSKAGLEFDDF